MRTEHCRHPSHSQGRQESEPTQWRATHTLMALLLFLNCHHYNSPPTSSLLRTNLWKWIKGNEHLTVCIATQTVCQLSIPIKCIRESPLPLTVVNIMILLHSCKIILNECSENRPSSLEAKPLCPVCQEPQSPYHVWVPGQTEKGRLRRALTSAPWAGGDPTRCPLSKGRKGTKLGGEHGTLDPLDRMAGARRRRSAFPRRRCVLSKKAKAATVSVTRRAP